MTRLTVDGRQVDVAGGATILDAAHALGIDVPTLCHDPRLEPSGACRLCVVAVDGQPRPVTACTAPAVEGMVVHTATDELRDVRTTLLGLLAADHPAGVAAARPDRRFPRLLAEYGVVAGGRDDPATSDDSHPIIHVDLSACIGCWRCVRICEEVQGQDVWHIAGRGAASRIVPDSGDLLGTSTCVACGACVHTCPTGALEDRALLGGPRPEAWTRTVCPYCAVGCELEVGTRAGRIVTVEPALDGPANRGHVCVKGRYGHGFVTAPDRQQAPMVRDGETWREVGWDEAIATAAAQLRRAVEAQGPAAVGVLGSARATNEDNYVLQKLARAVLGTNNVDCCARVCHAPSAAGLASVLGTGAATSSFDDIDRAATILICGANPTENHPVVGARIRQAVRRGANLIVIDPRRIELAGIADLYLQPRPGTNLPLLCSFAQVIIEEDLVDHDFLARRVDGLEELTEAVAGWTPEAAAEVCGVPAADIRAAARLYATGGPALTYHGLGVTEHRQGTDTVVALVDLSLLTGNLGRPGAGENPLRGQNNVQGSAHMGCEPAHLTGYATLDDGRARFEAVWGATVPHEPGLDAMQMLDAAATGDLTALLVVGWDVALTQPDLTTTRRALGALESLVVVDLFLNETARRFATVFLPATASFEKDGSFMSSERRIQRVRAAVPPPAGARPDWEIVALLGAALGRADLFPYDGPAAIWDEVRRVWPGGAGISYERLDAPGGLQWPCPDEAHPGTRILHTDAFGPSVGIRARLRPVAYLPSSEQPTGDRPLVLVTGRTLTQFNAGTMTGRSVTHGLRPTDRLELCPADAAGLGLADGDLARVRSRHGTATLPVEVTDRIAPGTAFATFHDPAMALNHVIGPGRDTRTNTPEYKVTAVSVEPAGG
jgi:formate dehydrogenase major subunit